MATTINRAPICAIGQHPISDAEYYYVVNPEGGYGRLECLCCETCVKKPENSVVRRRLIDCGNKELAD